MVVESPVLEDLQALVDQGVEIQACGTCLSYFGLIDKVAVGQVSNMYTIAETLLRAGKRRARWDSRRLADMDRQLGLPLSKPSYPRRQTKFYVGGIIVALVMAYLVVVSLRGGSTYYLTIAELRARGTDIVDRPVRVSAVVDSETIDYDVKSLTLRFAW